MNIQKVIDVLQEAQKKIGNKPIFLYLDDGSTLGRYFKIGYRDRFEDVNKDYNPDYVNYFGKNNSGDIVTLEIYEDE